MSKSNIPYVTDVWNPVVGCVKSSPGCAHCWAERMAFRLKKMGRPEYQEVVNDKGHWNGAVVVVDKRLDEPLHWRKPRTVLVCSMGDLFHPLTPDWAIHRVFVSMISVGAMGHTFLLLTKHPRRMDEMVARHFAGAGLPPSIWPGVSVENNDYRWRVEELVKIPAATRWVSVEPMIGPVDLTEYLFEVEMHGGTHYVTRDMALDAGMPEIEGQGIEEWWPEIVGPSHQIGVVVCGAESGPYRRPFDVPWAEDLYDQCKAAGVPYWGKQASGLRPGVPLLIHGKVIQEWP